MILVRHPLHRKLSDLIRDVIQTKSIPGQTPGLTFDQRLTKAYMLILGVISGTFVFIYVLADQLFFASDPELAKQLLRWRAFGFIICVLAWIAILRLQRSNYFDMAVIAIATLVLAYTSATVAPLRSIDEPWVHAAMLTPMLSTGIFVRWPLRIMLAIWFPAVFIGCHLWVHPIAMQDPALFVLLENTTFAALLAVGFGVALSHFTNMTNNQQELLAEQTRQLLAANASLEQTVRERTAELQRLSDARDDLLETERARVAKDLHDDLGQLLASLKLDLHLLQTDLPSQADPDKLVGPLQHSISNVIKKVRDVIQDLQPQWLFDQGLLWAIERLADYINRSSSVHVDVETSGDHNRMMPSLRLPIYRVVSEAVTNAVKHAKATNITIQIGIGEQALELLVIDDGCGIDFSTAASGSGLINMRERIGRIGGRLGIVSQPGRTAIHAIVPLPQGVAA